MAQYPIYVSDTIYRLLVKRAAQESKSLEQVAEYLLTQELTLSAELDNGHDVVIDTEEALAAVHRLTNLFADVEFNELEQLLISGSGTMSKISRRHSPSQENS